MSVLRCVEKRHVALVMVLYLINAKGYASHASSAIREELIIIKRKIISLSEKGRFPPPCIFSFISFFWVEVIMIG